MGGICSMHERNEHLKERYYLKDIGVDVRVIFKLTLKKEGVRMWTEFS
jgi:hypothetical protein